MKRFSLLPLLLCSLPIIVQGNGQQEGAAQRLPEEILKEIREEIRKQVLPEKQRKLAGISRAWRDAMEHAIVIPAVESSYPGSFRRDIPPQPDVDRLEWILSQAEAASERARAQRVRFVKVEPGGWNEFGALLSPGQSPVSLELSARVVRRILDTFPNLGPVILNLISWNSNDLEQLIGYFSPRNEHPLGYDPEIENASAQGLKIRGIICSSKNLDSTQLVRLLNVFQNIESVVLRGPDAARWGTASDVPGFTKDVYDAIAGLGDNLRFFDISDSPSFDGEALEAIVLRCPRLEILKISNCKFLKTRDFDHIAGLRKLKSLTVESFTGEGELDLETARRIKTANPEVRIVTLPRLVRV